MNEQPRREGEPAAQQAQENAARASQEPGHDDDEHRREGEPAAEQARDEEA